MWKCAKSTYPLRVIHNCQRIHNYQSRRRRCPNIRGMWDNKGKNTMCPANNEKQSNNAKYSLFSCTDCCIFSSNTTSARPLVKSYIAEMPSLSNPCLRTSELGKIAWDVQLPDRNYCWYYTAWYALVPSAAAALSCEIVGSDELMINLFESIKLYSSYSGISTANLHHKRKLKVMWDHTKSKNHTWDCIHASYEQIKVILTN